MFVVDVVALQGAAGIGAVLPWAAVDLSVAGSTVTTGVWALVGLFFLEGQFVSLSAGGSGVSLFGAAEGFLSVPYRLLPVVVLAVAGALVARQRGAETPGDGAVAGGALALGYLPLLAILAVAIGATSDIQPSILVAAVVGLGLPLVVGAVGGAAVGAAGGSESKTGDGGTGADAAESDPQSRGGPVEPGPATQEPPRDRGDVEDTRERPPRERTSEGPEGDRSSVDRPPGERGDSRRDESDRSDGHSEWDPR